MSLFSNLRKLWDPVQLQLWVGDTRDQRGLPAFGKQQLAIFMLTLRHLRDDEISRRAAALTYYTLLSLVPLLAVGFALFKAFGGLQKLEGPLRAFVVENLAGSRQEEVGRWLDNFVNNINAGAIAGVGVLILFYSAVGLLTNVEKSFNRIWGVTRMRSLPLRFAIYWCVITLAPLLVGLSLSISARLQSHAFTTGLIQWLPLGLGRLLVSGLGVLAVCLAFVMLYVIVPNTRVHWRCALLGGLVAALLWSGSKVLFIWVSSGSAKYSAVYGALSVLPLMILWMYYSWQIVLFGTTFAYANQMIRSNALLSRALVPTPAFRERLSARLMVEVARGHEAGDPLTAEDLADRTNVMLPVVQQSLDLLAEHGLLVLADVYPKGHSKRAVQGYVPQRSLQTLTLDDVVNVVRDRAGTSLKLEECEESERSTALLDRAGKARSEVLSSVDLASLARSGSPPEREESEPSSG